eukprot:CAMPEP_0171934648 /NCGR_PEP_ID=MMETSP0993-20121228/32193_1 /TAXON_ID=483369 /ORGANISM="non described non described, Strain CCMP2098" /LENGTH=403 /DNA_ID=CAMNT_0012575403 /DNA_START=48 /DNA_END=1256 /DNA_ORIENTATION=+
MEFCLLAFVLQMLVVDSIISFYGCKPSQIHISPGTPAHSTMWVSWMSDIKCSSVVERLGGSSSLQVTTAGVGERYATTTNRYGTYVSAFQHHARLDGLEPSTSYQYRCGGGEDSGSDEAVFGSWREFKTLPKPGGTQQPVRIAIVGDLGQTADSLATVRSANLSAQSDYSSLGHGVEPSFLMIVGDLSYADGNGTRWDTWGHLMEPWLSTALPLVAMPGNHEIEMDSETAETFPHWRARFRMPEVAPEQSAPGQVNDYPTYDFDFHYEFGSSYFSFDSGPVHHVCLNAYADSSKGSTQYEWLKRDLKQHDKQRSAVPWVVVYAHGPWYNSNKLHRQEVATQAMRLSLEDLLHEHKVALFLAGHVHAYERTHPAFKGKRARSTTRSTTANDGGGDEEWGTVYVT